MPWRAKSLNLAEWSTLQDHFANLQIRSGAPKDLAMFLKSRAGESQSELYITGPGIEVIEAMSPGGWADADTPSGPGIALLVGTDDPWTYFGIEKPE